MSPDIFHFENDGLRLAGERWDGGPRGEVLLLHGGGQTRHSWQRTAERLAKAGWAATALDGRGHGDSDWDPAEDYSLDAYVRDLVAFIDTLSSRPVLVGASLGGITSLTVAGEYPEISAGLVLVDVVVTVEPSGSQRIRDFMSSAPQGFTSLADVADAVSAYNPHRPRPKNLDGLRKNVRQHADGRWYWHWDPAFMRIADEPHRQVDPARLRAAASRLQVPTFIVRGGQSDVVSDAGLAEMLELVPTAQVVDVASAGHMVAGDDNDVFARGLDAFMGQIDAQRTATSAK